jgi:hypothetical protein
MANEAVIIELLGDGGDAIKYTIADATAVPKGTVMKVTDPRTAAVTTAVDEPIIGIAAHEKVTLDGSTSISCFTNGIFDMKDSGAGIAVGVACAIAGANTIATADAADLLQGSVIGQTLETAAAAEVIAVRVLK